MEASSISMGHGFHGYVSHNQTVHGIFCHRSFGTSSLGHFFLAQWMSNKTHLQGIHR